MANNESIKQDYDIIEESNGDVEHKSYKLYNFRRPDKFSKDNLRALRDIHREFSKSISLILSGYLRMRVEIEIVSVDQLTYEEFVRSVVAHTDELGKVNLKGIAAEMGVGVDAAMENMSGSMSEGLKKVAEE